MATASGELATFQPGPRAIVPFSANFPVRVDPGVVILVNTSSDAMWIDPRQWSTVPVIEGVRAPVRKRRVASHAAKAAAIFAIGFSSALLYSAEPADRGVIRIMLPPPARIALLPPPAKMGFPPAERSLAPLSQPILNITAILPPVAAATTPPAPELRAPPSPARAISITDLAPVRAASELAIKTDVAQPWRGLGLHGVVVAGPIQFAGAGACRTVAVWVEARGVPGKSVSSRYCLAAGGIWARDVAPASSDSGEPGGELGEVDR